MLGAKVFFLTPPRVRSRERMEGRRPAEIDAGVLLPINPRAAATEGRELSGSPLDVPSDILHDLPKRSWRKHTRRLVSSPGRSKTASTPAARSGYSTGPANWTPVRAHARAVQPPS
uniref:Uncharacterized protein n=1 Tax=Micrurus corallinus TaxID=54390 RepID=A0A2D4GWS5_MICCO